MSKTRIAIDISPLNDGNSVRGVGYYTKNLVSALQKETKTNPEYKNFKIHLIDNCSLKIDHFDLIHYPYFDPFFLTLPRKKNIPTIITIHDLIPLEFKKHFPVGIRGEIKWLIQKHRARQSDYIIAVSHYSKHSIKNILHYPEDRIFVTHEGASQNFRPIIDKKYLSSIKKKYNLPNKFVLFLGDINWNKNVRKLVIACKDLKIPLVIVGSAAAKEDVIDHPWNSDLIWLKKHKHELITLTGFVPDSELPAIFNLATVYCQPSFAEGFGLPLVQAMQSGTPVAYSRESCLNEIMDYNGEMFDPYSLKSMKKSLKHLYQNPSLQAKYSKKGLLRAKFFSWRKTAIQTLTLYKLALVNDK